MTYVSSSQVILAIIVVVAACVGCAAAVEAARRSRNWLWITCAVGLAVVVVGVVGQRAVPTGSDASGGSGSIWDASVSLPGSGIQVTAVAVGGFLLAAAGLSLVLFFEPAGEPRRPKPQPKRRLEDDDAI